MTEKEKQQDGLNSADTSLKELKNAGNTEDLGAALSELKKDINEINELDWQNSAESSDESNKD